MVPWALVSLVEYKFQEKVNTKGLKQLGDRGKLKYVNQ